MQHVIVLKMAMHKSRVYPQCATVPALESSFSSQALCHGSNRPWGSGVLGDWGIQGFRGARVAGMLAQA
jgi:hypothetical protein